MIRFVAKITNLVSGSVESDGVGKAIARVVDGEACYRDIKFENVAGDLSLDQDVEIFIVPAIDRERVAESIREFLNSKMQVGNKG